LNRKNPHHPGSRITVGKDETGFARSPQRNKTKKGIIERKTGGKVKEILAGDLRRGGEGHKLT